VDTLTFESLAVNPSAAARAALAEADVIIGIDMATEREFTVFGIPSLQSTATLKRPSAMRTVRVSFDFQAGELDKLIALVRAAKGRDECAGTDE
jgi:hypothetical protein